MTQNNIAIQNLIIDELLISPIETIINNLKKGEYSDRDIPYLNDNLNKYSGIILQTLNIKIVIPNNTGITMLNTYGVSRYLGYFNVILKYFKNIK